MSTRKLPMRGMQAILSLRKEEISIKRHCTNIGHGQYSKEEYLEKKKDECGLYIYVEYSSSQ